MREPVLTPARPLSLPLIGASYGEVLRSPRWRWWNPVVAWVLAIVLGLVAVFVPMLVYGFTLAATTGAEAFSTDMEMTPSMTFVLNVSLALLIVVSLVAVAIGFPVAARFLHSVEGRVRWAWLIRCVLVLLPLFVVYVVGVWALDGARSLGPSQGWPALLAMAVFMTPLQAAGEEYLFRGFVLASIGSCFRRPIVGLVVAGTLSTVLFAAAHGSMDPWILIDLGGIAVACVYLTWRTGGLEAAVALHTTNNVVVFFLGILTGTVSESYVDNTTTGTPEQALVSVAVSALATVLLLWQAKRVGVHRAVPASVGARP